MRSSLKKIAFIIIIAAGIFLRFHGIRDKGFFEYDEAYLYLEAKPTILAIGWAAGNFVKLFSKPDLLSEPGQAAPSLRAYIEEQGGGVYWPSVAKPGYFLLNVISSLFLGVKDRTPFFTSAIFGVATLLFVYLLGEGLFGWKAGLPAMAVAAVSGYHVLFSRLALSIAAAVFFLVLSVYLYANALRGPSAKGRLYAGLSLGFAFTLHYNLGIFIGLFLIMEGLSWLVRNPLEAWRRRISRASALAVGLALPPLAIEAAYRTLNFALGSSRITYFQQISRQLGKVASMESSGAARPFLFLVDSESWLLLTFAAVGIVYLIVKLKKEGSLSNLFIALICIVPIVQYLILASHGPFFPRTVVSAIPFLSIAGGYGVSKLLDLSKRFGRLWCGTFTTVICMVFAISLVSNFGKAAAASRIKSGYRETAGFISQKEGTMALFGGGPIYMFYLKSIDRVKDVAGVDDIKKMYKRGQIDYYVADYRVDFLFDIYRSEDLSLIDFEKQYSPAMTIANPVGRFMPIIAESYVSQEMTKAVMLKSSSDKIRIYDLHQIFRDDSEK